MTLPIVPGWTAADWQTLVAMSARLRMNPKHLARVLASESGLKAAARNPPGGSVAVGLNQLTRISNSVTGLTEAERVDFPNWSVARQLPVVERFFAENPWTKAGRAYPSIGKIYQANAAGGTMFSAPGPTDPISKAGSSFYASSVALDMNKDGLIDQNDLEAFASRPSVNTVYNAAAANIDAAIAQGPQRSTSAMVGFAMGAALLAYVFLPRE